MRPTWIATLLPSSPCLLLMSSEAIPGWNSAVLVPVGMVTRFLQMAPRDLSSSPMQAVGVTTTSILFRICLR